MGFLDTNTQRGLLAILGCLLVDASVGEYNLLSLLYPYFGSYFHYKDSRISTDDTPIIGAIWLMTQAFSGIIGVWINGFLGFKLTFSLMVFIFGLGQYLASYIENYHVFIFAYAIPGGFAQGALIILPLYCAWRYFSPIHKGKISGIILSAYALAPILSSFAASRIINPSDVDVIKKDDGKKYFPEDIANNVPRFIRTFACICIAVGFAGILMILEPFTNEKKVEKSDNGEPAKEKLIEASNTETPQAKTEHVVQLNIPRLTWKDLKDNAKDKHFWYLFGCVFIGYTYCHFVNYSFKKIGLNHLEKADTFINRASSIAAIFNALARPIAALAFEKWGFLPCTLGIMAMQMLSALTFVWAADHRVTYTISLCFYFMTYGGQLGLYPLVCEALYSKKGALVYSCTFSGFSISALMVAFTYKSILEKLGEEYMYFMLGCLPPFSGYFLWQTNKKLLSVKKSKQNASVNQTEENQPKDEQPKDEQPKVDQSPSH